MGGDDRERAQRVNFAGRQAKGGSWILTLGLRIAKVGSRIAKQGSSLRTLGSRIAK
jgi:hypothetical protein